VGAEEGASCYAEGRSAHLKTHATTSLRGHRPKRRNRALAGTGSSARTRWAVKARMKARAWTMADPLEPFMKGYWPRGPKRYEDDDNALTNMTGGTTLM
jgi:hypothetical protein